MLNADARLTIDAVPGAIVYADNMDRGRVYAFAASPRIALDENGVPQLSLLLYRHGKDAPPEGGQLTLTTSLALTDGERAGVAAALASSPPARHPIISQAAQAARRRRPPRRRRRTSSPRTGCPGR